MEEESRTTRSKSRIKASPDHDTSMEIPVRQDKPWKKPDGEENTVRVQRHVARKFPTTSDENQSESEADESCKLSTEEEGKFSEKKFGTAKRSYPPICDGNPGRRSVSVSEISIHSRSDERSPEIHTIISSVLNGKILGDSVGEELALPETNCAESARADAALTKRRKQNGNVEPLKVEDDDFEAENTIVKCRRSTRNHAKNGSLNGRKEPSTSMVRSCTPPPQKNKKSKEDSTGGRSLGLRKRKAPDRLIEISPIPSDKDETSQSSESEGSMTSDYRESRPRHHKIRRRPRRKSRHPRKAFGYCFVPPRRSLRDKSRRKSTHTGTSAQRDSSEGEVADRRTRRGMGVYGLRNLRGVADADNDSNLSWESGGNRRNPPRSGRPPHGTLIAPETVAELMDSDISVEPPKKKLKAAKSNDAATYSDFEPTIYFPTKEISFDTIGGCSATKDTLRRELLLPFREQIQRKESELLNETSVNLHLTKGALFWGPPGTGKTLMAKAVAFECSRDLTRLVPVYVISGAELLTKWVGESESHLREIFRHASENSPSIIFIDELDGLVRRRTSSETDHVNFNMVSTLLTLLNGVLDRGTVLVIATTNFKDVIDPALIRSGRFDLKVFFPAPSADERALIIKALTNKWKRELQPEEVATIASSTTDFTGADLDLLCKRARNFAVSRSGEEISKSDVVVGLNDFYKALLDVEVTSNTFSCSPTASFQPLDRRTSILLEKQFNSLVQKLISSFPVKLPSTYMPGAELGETAAFARFCHPHLMLDYSPVIFIYSHNDTLLLDLVSNALVNLLSQKNTVRTIDFGGHHSNQMMSDLTSLLNDRSIIVGLLHLDEVCNARTSSSTRKDKLELTDYVANALQKRNKWLAPLILVTTNCPPEKYGADLYEAFGKDFLTFEVKPPNDAQCRTFYQELCSKEKLQAVQEDGSSSDESNIPSEKTLEKLLIGISEHMSERPMDDILTEYRALSLAVWTDRGDPSKPSFLARLRRFSERRVVSRVSTPENDTAATSDAVQVFNFAALSGPEVLQISRDDMDSSIICTDLDIQPKRESERFRKSSGRKKQKTYPAKLELPKLKIKRHPESGLTVSSKM